ncbi:MAG: hypothetical protein J0L92_19055 [Deltaproteobacteria bacterium]|nr:hypothetical protein [Deltaproteobacteria bacterium]
MTVDDKIEGEDSGMVIKVFCKVCRVQRDHRLAKLKRAHPGQDPAKRWYGYEAVCVECGNVAADHYNWGGGLSMYGMREQDERLMEVEKARGR